MTRLGAILLAALATLPALAGCTQPAPSPPSGATGCPTGEVGYLAIAVQEDGLAPHPEVFTVEASGLVTGVVLAQGRPANGTVGVPERALNNVTADEVRRVLDAADQPDAGTWNVSLAFQATASTADVDALCKALTDSAPEMAPSYPDEDCRDGTTLTLTAWTPDGFVVSSAHCEGGQGTAFEDVRLALRNATATARERSGTPS